MVTCHFILSAFGIVGHFGSPCLRQKRTLLHAVGALRDEGFSLQLRSAAQIIRTRLTTTTPRTESDGKRAVHEIDAGLETRVTPSSHDWRATLQVRASRLGVW